MCRTNSHKLNISAKKPMKKKVHQRSVNHQRVAPESCYNMEDTADTTALIQFRT